MSIGFTFSACSLFYSILLTIVFFSKKRLNSLENKIYSWTIIANLIGVVLALSCYYTILNHDALPIINTIISKGLLIYYLTFLTLLTTYIYIVSYKIESQSDQQAPKKVKSVFHFIIAIYLFLCLLTILLPLHYFHEGDVAYSFGPSANLVYAVSMLVIVVWLVLMFRNIKGIKNKKYLPLFAFILIGTIVIIIQRLNPGILLMTSMETYVTFLMYFTIENPDLKLINELNIAKDQAEKANHAKTDFLSNMSHEIRTPLNAIVGFSQALIEEEIPDAAKEEVKDIMMASDNLLELVNGILDISKIEANKLEIVNTEYQLNKILNELVVLTKTRIGTKPIEFRTDFDKSMPQVLYGDYTRLKQIILNLLTNAAKYTKEGYIEFKVSSVVKEDICRLIISVEDTGIGIAKDKIDKLFTKFERLDVEKNITIEGTGLGLAITKKLVELMNGTIVVHSTYGQGSKFTVAIDQKIIATKGKLENEQQTESTVSYFDLSSKKILLVDDNKLNLKVATRLLKNYQVQIVSCMSGIECLEQIQQQSFDLILLDDMMPQMSGTETLKKLKSLPNFNVPTVALTANAITGMREKYLKEGFDDYLAKPIQKEELNYILAKYLKEEKK